MFHPEINLKFKLSEKLRKCENNLSVMSNEMKNSNSQNPWREFELNMSQSTSKNIHFKPQSDCSTQTQAEESNSQVNTLTHV